MTVFHQLIEQQIPRLRRYARALTPNPERADDLVQDTLVRALAKQHFRQPGSNISAWLFTLMQDQKVNTVRRAIREGGIRRHGGAILAADRHDRSDRIAKAV
jgi:RNA polymerase sigma-70 factor (ECF subfamily)